MCGFDSIKNQAEGLSTPGKRDRVNEPSIDTVRPEAHATIVTGLREMITTKGLRNVLQALQDNALGANSGYEAADDDTQTAIPGNFLRGVLDPEQISQLAERAGVSRDVVSCVLSRALPGVLGRLAAGGPAAGSAVGGASGSTVSS
jgi:uncharacterized protein YidB (DUF937 family)